MCECEYVCEKGGRGVHGEAGAKLEAETSQIACEMKQTIRGKKTRQHMASEKCRARQAGTKAKDGKQTHSFFLLDIFQTADDKNNTGRVRGIKIKPPSVSVCFMHPCRSGGSAPHQTLSILLKAASSQRLDYCVQLKGKCWECHTWECVLSTIKYQDPDGSSSLKYMSTLSGLRCHLLPGLGECYAKTDTNRQSRIW